MKSLARRIRHIILTPRFPGVRCLPLLLSVVFIFCLFGTADVVPSRAGEYDWAIPSGPLPDVPPVGDPVCAYCNGAGCSHCQPDTGGGDDVVDPDPKPNPAPNPGPTPGLVVTPKPVTPVPPVDPQQLFERQKEALLKEFRMPAGLMDDLSGLPTAPPAAVVEDHFGMGAVPVGLSDSEWKEAAECQKTLDALYAKWPLSEAEIAEADKLEARRNTLWKRAISVPGLTAEERERLRLKLHTLNTRPDTSVPALSEETVKKWQTPPSLPTQSSGKPAVPTINPVASWLVGQFALGQAQGALELGGELWADQILEDHSFGDFLGVGKIALAYKDGGASSALAETCNFLVGKIGIPQANIAVEGGRQYANIVFHAQNKFMTDAMKAAGGEFDKEKFWSDFNEDLNVGQRAVKEWVGYGTE